MSRARCFPVLEPEYLDPAALQPILDNVFTFNGETHRLGTPPDWCHNPSADREWHILLHKFYYAPALGHAFVRTRDDRYLAHWMALTRSWIEQVPVGFIAADVTGRRIQNWIYAYQYFVGEQPTRVVPVAFEQAFIASLGAQVNDLFENLHAKRNHRTLELHALFLAGLVFPELPGPVDWRTWALDALCENIATDLLPDGVHCELASDYHHIVLRNCLAVRRLCAEHGMPFPATADTALQRALDFALHAHKPDGVVPALSDGDARSHRDVLALGAALYARADYAYAATAGATGRAPAEAGRAFAAGGYCFMRSDWGKRGAYADARYLAFDCGPLGEGNHGHFDALSVELAAFGRSLVVDPGRFTYHEAGAVNWRARFRGTAAHNTVLVDGRNQTRYEPGPLRCKVRGPAPAHELRAFALSEPADDDCSGYVCGAAASHEYDAVHLRRIFFPRGDYWVIVDDLEARAPHEYELRFQLSELAAGHVARHDIDGGLALITPQLVFATSIADGEIRVEDGQVAYQYGQRLAAPRIVHARRALTTRFVSVLVPYRVEAPQLRLRRLPLDTGAERACDFALVIELGDGRHVRRDVCLGICGAADEPRGASAAIVTETAVPGTWRPLLGRVDSRVQALLAQVERCR